MIRSFNCRCPLPTGFEVQNLIRNEEHKSIQNDQNITSMLND